MAGPPCLTVELLLLMLLFACISLFFQFQFFKVLFSCTMFEKMLTEFLLKFTAILRNFWKDSGIISDSQP